MRRGFQGVLVLALALLAPTGVAQAKKRDPLDKIGHIVVIYEENHSFDNLYGGWEKVVGVKGQKGTQVNQAGQPFQCLLQNDVNLTAPPLSVRCSDTTTTTAFNSHFLNAPFLIDGYIAPEDTTCPPPGVFAANG